MKCVYFLTFLLALAAADDEKYTTENDDFDIAGAVANPEVLKSIVDCTLDTAECNEIIADFKKDIPEAISTACKKCTNKQKNIFHQFIEGLKVKLPKEFEAFKQKYDPKGDHFDKLEKAVANF